MSTTQQMLETIESAVSDLQVPRSVLYKKLRQAAAARKLANSGPHTAKKSKSVRQLHGRTDTSERTVRLFAYHELRTAFWSEEEDFVDGSVIRRPIDATKLEDEHSTVLKRAAKFYLQRVQSACLEASRPVDQTASEQELQPHNPHVSRFSAAETSGQAATRLRSVQSFQATGSAVSQQRRGRPESRATEASQASSASGRQSRESTSRPTSKESLRRGRSSRLSRKLSRRETMLSKQPSFRVNSYELKFVACRLTKSEAGDVTLVTLRADLSSLQEYSDVAVYRRTMEQIIKGFYEQQTRKRSRLAARRASVTARRMSTGAVGYMGAMTLQEAAAMAAAEHRGELPSTYNETSSRVSSRPGAGGKGKGKARRRSSVVGGGRRISAFGGTASKVRTEAPDGPRGIASLAAPAEMSDTDAAAYYARRELAKQQSAALLRLAKMKFFVVETHNARTGVSKLQRHSFDSIIANVASHKLVMGAVQLMQDLGLRQPGPGPMRPSAHGLGIGIDSTAAGESMTDKQKKIASAIEAAAGFSAEDKLGAGKFSDPVTLAVAPVRIPGGAGSSRTRRAVVAVRMRYRRTEFDKERTIEIRTARQKKPKAIPLPLINPFSSTHSLTRFQFLTIDPRTGEELDRSEMTYAELVAAQKFGLADLADDVIAAMELAEARLHERILDHLTALRLASKEVQEDGRGELLASKQPTSRNEGATRIQQAVRRWMVRTRARKAQELAVLVLRSKAAKAEVKAKSSKPVRASNIRHWLTGLQTWTIGARVARAIAAKRRLVGSEGRVWVDGGTGEQRVKHPIAPREPKDLSPYNPPMFALQDLRTYVEEQKALDGALERTAGAFIELGGVPREARLASQEALQLTRNRGAALVRGFMRYARANFVRLVYNGNYDYVGGEMDRAIDQGKQSLGYLEYAVNSDRADPDIYMAASMAESGESRLGIHLNTSSSSSHGAMQDAGSPEGPRPPIGIRYQLHSRSGEGDVDRTSADAGAIVVYPRDRQGATPGMQHEYQSHRAPAGAEGVRDIADPIQRLPTDIILEQGGIVPLSSAADALYTGKYRGSTDGLLRVMVHGKPSTNPSHFLPKDGISQWARFLDDDATFAAIGRQFEDHAKGKEVEEVPPPDPIGLTIYTADPYKVPLPPQEVINHEMSNAQKLEQATVQQAIGDTSSGGGVVDTRDIAKAAHATVVRRARTRAALSALADTIPAPSAEALARYAAQYPSTRQPGNPAYRGAGTGDSSWVNASGSVGAGTALEFVKLYNRTINAEPPVVSKQQQAEEYRKLEQANIVGSDDAFRRFVFGRMRDSADSMRHTLQLQAAPQGESGPTAVPYTRSSGGLRARRSIEYRTAAMQQGLQMGYPAGNMVIPGVVDTTTGSPIDAGLGYRSEWASDRERIKGWIKPGKKGRVVNKVVAREPPVGKQAHRLASSGFSVD